MKKEQYIKETLTDYESPVDMNSLWADLETQLDKEKTNRKSIWFWIKGLGLIAILTAVPFLIYQLSNNDNKAQETSSLKNTINNEHLSTELITKPKESPSNLITSSQVIPDEDLRVTKQKEDRSSISKRTVFNRSNETSQSVMNSNDDRPITEKKGSQYNTAQTKTSINNLLNPSSTMIEAAATVDTESPKTPTKLLLNIFENLPSLQLLLTRDSDDKIKEAELPIEPIQKTKRAVEQPIWRASIGLGQSRSQYHHPTTMGLTENFIADRYNYENSINNFTASLSLERINKKGIVLGLDINYINHAVAYEREGRYTSAISLTDIQTATFVDSNGYVLGESQEATVPVTYNWSFRHINELKTLELAPIIGYNSRWNRLDYSLTMGPSINYFYKQVGLLPDPNSFNAIAEIPSISAEELTIENSAQRIGFIGLSAKLNAQVGYFVSDKLRAFSSFEAAQHFSNLASEEKSITKLRHGALRLGLSYDF